MNSPPLLLGHRGARKYKPENTLAAFDQALAHGCDGFEFDVRVTSDDQALICHDPEYAGHTIAATPYSNRVMHELLEFESVVSLYRQSFLDIELKVVEAAPHVAAAIAKCGLSGSYIASSFLPQALRDLHAANASIALGLIADTAEDLAAWKTLPLAYVLPEQAFLTPAFLAEAHAAGKKVIPWTVNEEPRMREFLQMGVDGLISDDTALLRQVADAMGRGGSLATRA